MNFSRCGELDVVTRISGPHHHYLALRLQTDCDSPFIDVESVSPDGLIGRSNRRARRSSFRSYRRYRRSESTDWRPGIGLRESGSALPTHLSPVSTVRWPIN